MGTDHIEFKFELTHKKPAKRMARGWLVVYLLCIISTLVGCTDTKELGVEIDGQRVQVIDMHLHPGLWKDIPPETQKFLSTRFPFPFKLNPEDLAKGALTAEGILSELDVARVQGGLLFAVYAPKTVGICSNEYVAAQVKKDPKRLFGLASLRVDRWNQDKDEQLKALRTGLQQPGIVGIKLAHAHMHFRMDDPNYYEIYKISEELKKPIYLHTGSSPFPNISQKDAYTNPNYLEDAIKKHPKAIFILGHLGFDFIKKKHKHLDDCLRLAKTYENVYLEASAFGSESGDPTGANLQEAMQKIRDKGLIPRVIYGSDGPQSPGFVKNYLARTIKAMKASGYTTDEMKAVLSENFKRVFNVQLK